ncbi:glycine betaine ABC transporter substrate-binding protein [Skermanella rosea]|uniref:glycine betaine ABC transporter substrate-binding protein n=1 Tax=Skermanella rosea TaxID=1817965 RepID=UPI00193169E0|nr:glycine betaine ABC transporter substrate-binding protein [Skermanella rosea]UEM01424.1 glycine betaine ABC transporter substrate-binding protein [Skermanella rosea]
MKRLQLFPILGAFLVTFLGAAGAFAKEPIRIGLNNWAEAIAVSHMWQQVLGEKGYEVELKTVEKAILYTGLSTDAIDVALEIWMPTTDAAYYDRFKDRIDLHESWYHGARLGLAVPAYMEIGSIEDLKDRAATFGNGRSSDGIVGIEAGSSLMAMTEQAIKTYGLDYNLVTSSEVAMISALDRAYRQENPVVVTLWSPHWVFAKYDLKYLQDPRNAYGATDDIHFMSRKGFAEDYPEVLGWLNAWSMDDDSLGSLMAEVNEANSPEEGARAWIAENRALVDGWLEPQESARE